MAAGRVLNQVTRVSEAPDVLIRRLALDVSGATGYSLTMAGTYTMVLARAVTPKWPLFAGGIGFVVFSLSLLSGSVTGLVIAMSLLLIGFLYFVLETTESMTVRVSVDADMTAVSVSGRATPDLVTRIGDCLGTGVSPPSTSSRAQSGTSRGAHT